MWNWAIELNWNGTWIRVPGTYQTQSKAETAIGHWKQTNECYQDPFRTVEVPPKVQLDKMKTGG